MRTRNTCKYALIFVMIGTLVSCKKFLEVQPKEDISDDQTIVDGITAQTAVRGMYNLLGSNNYYGFSFLTIPNYSADNVQYVGSQSVNRQLTNHDVKPDLGVVGTVWSAIYATINSANTVLAKVPEIEEAPNFSAQLKNQLLGEAYFIRALAYFDLARTWGGVQLIVHPSGAPENEGIKRSSLEQTYAQVLSDLESAEQLLPETTNRIRATKKTAWALRARYHLYKGQWQEAETYATKLIGDSANYRLVYPYNAFFANNARATAESVFELYYSINITNSQASQWQPSNNGGVGWITPTDAFVTLANAPAIGGNRNALLLSIVNAGVTRWFGNLFYRTTGTDPAFLIRIAELYLIRAEARAQLNNLPGAEEDLNSIRKRADLAAVSLTSKDAALSAIEQENRLEFGFEGHRWYDLVRTGRAATVLGFADTRKYVLPIPFKELDVDENLVQNDGY